MSIFLVIYIIGFGFSAIYYSKQYSEEYIYISTTGKGCRAILDSLFWPVALVCYSLGKIGEWLDSKF